MYVLVQCHSPVQPSHSWVESSHGIALPIQMSAPSFASATVPSQTAIRHSVSSSLGWNFKLSNPWTRTDHTLGL